MVSGEFLLITLRLAHNKPQKETTLTQPTSQIVIYSTFLSTVIIHLPAAQKHIVKYLKIPNDDITFHLLFDG